MEYPLKKGQALILVGPQGSGKTTLARQIAARNGTYAEIDAWGMEHHFGLWRALLNQPDTLIVDGMPGNNVAIDRINTMLTSDMIRCDRQHAEPTMAKTPNLIFCTGAIDPWHEIASDTRFRIVQMGEPVAASNA